MKKITISLITLLSINVYAGGDITPPEIDVDVPVNPPMESLKYGVAFKLGTLGAGLDVSIPLKDKINLRFNLNGGTYDDDTTEGGINYAYDLDLLTVGLLLDYYPMEASEFRVTGGVYYNGNEAELCAKPGAGGIKIGNNPIAYTATELGSLHGDVEFDEIAPYIGIGWGNAVKKGGWSFNADVGIMYQGSPDVTLTPNYGTLSAGKKTTLDNDIAQELKDLQDDLDDYKVYPVVSFGATYTF